MAMIREAGRSPTMAAHPLQTTLAKPSSAVGLNRKQVCIVNDLRPMTYGLRPMAMQFACRLELEARMQGMLVHASLFVLCFLRVAYRSH